LIRRRDNGDLLECTHDLRPAKWLNLIARSSITARLVGSIEDDEPLIEQLQKNLPNYFIDLRPTLARKEPAGSPISDAYVFAPSVVQ